MRCRISSWEGYREDWLTLHVDGHWHGQSKLPRAIELSSMRKAKAADQECQLECLRVKHVQVSLATHNDRLNVKRTCKGKNLVHGVSANSGEVLTRPSDNCLCGLCGGWPPCFQPADDLRKVEIKVSNRVKMVGWKVFDAGSPMKLQPQRRRRRRSVR